VRCPGSSGCLQAGGMNETAEYLNLEHRASLGGHREIIQLLDYKEGNRIVIHIVDW